MVTNALINSMFFWVALFVIDVDCESYNQIDDSLSSEENEIAIDCENGNLLSIHVCLPKGYTKAEVPKKPTNVITTFEINNIREVNDKEMRITIDFYEELIWIDNRIKTNIPPNDSIVLNNELIRSIWKPDLWIKNLFSFKIHGVLEPTSGLYIVSENYCATENCSNETMKTNTKIVYNLEAQATIYCNFQFFYYPMDYQTCDFEMDGAYPRPGIVNFIFHAGFFAVTNKNAILDDFEINVTYKDGSNRTGIHGVITLGRSIFPYVIKYYLPCIAIIAMSALSFVMSKESEAIVGRVALLVTQFLTLTNILIAQQAESPSAGGFTAIGFYLLTSLFFLTAAFIESIYIISLHHANKSRYAMTMSNHKRLRKKKEESNGTVKSVHQDGNSQLDMSEIYKDKFDIQKIDYYAFLFSGISFLVFNLVYWTLFLLFSRS